VEKSDDEDSEYSEESDNNDGSDDTDDSEIYTDSLSDTTKLHEKTNTKQFALNIVDKIIASIVKDSGTDSHNDRFLCDDSETDADNEIEFLSRISEDIFCPQDDCFLQRICPDIFSCTIKTRFVSNRDSNREVCFWFDGLLRHPCTEEEYLLHYNNEEGLKDDDEDENDNEEYEDDDDESRNKDEEDSLDFILRSWDRCDYQLWSAVRNGRLEEAIDALRSGASVHRGQAELGNMPALHLAVLGGNTEVIKMIVKAGADLRARDTEGRTALGLALSLGYGHGNYRLKRLLEAVGGDLYSLVK